MLRKTAIVKPREFVEKYYIKSIVCCFSGGKDSLVATHYTLKELEDVDIEKYVVFVDTTVMVPGTIDFVKSVCERFNWNLVVLRPEKSFWEYAERWGAPTIRRRWCCYFLKLKPIIDFVKKLRPQRAEVLGLRWEESEKRSKLPQVIYKKKISSWGYCPIISWSEKQVLSYMKKHDLPIPPHYRLGIKETCMCGAFSHIKELMCVRANFPEFYQKFVELENKFTKGGTVFYFNNRPYSAKEILKQKILDEFFEEEGSYVT